MGVVSLPDLQRTRAISPPPCGSLPRRFSKGAELSVPKNCNTKPVILVFSGCTAVAGVVILFFLKLARYSVLGAAATVAGIVAAVGLGHYLLWGRVISRGVVQEMQRVQDQDCQ
jgi:hypothetical protein